MTTPRGSLAGADTGREHRGHGLPLRIQSKPSVRLANRHIVKAYKEVGFVKAALKSSRESVDTLHARIYRNALEIASKLKVNVEEDFPRRTGRQQHRTGRISNAVLSAGVDNTNDRLSDC